MGLNFIGISSPLWPTDPVRNRPERAESKVWNWRKYQSSCCILFINICNALQCISICIVYIFFYIVYIGLVNRLRLLKYWMLHLLLLKYFDLILWTAVTGLLLGCANWIVEQDSVTRFSVVHRKCNLSWEPQQFNVGGLTAHPSKLLNARTVTAEPVAKAFLWLIEAILLMINS